MLDRLGRKIDYLRISVTDRCDLRCVYCMPEQGVAPMCHGDILRYEDILRLARIFAQLGIKKLRLTGGEPLVRRDLDKLLAGLKAIPGIEAVVLTTNGMQLAQQLPALVNAGLDGVNISLDALDEDVFQKITRRSGVASVRSGIDAVLSYPKLKLKINCVPTPINRQQIIPLVQTFAAHKPISLRFIELMPIGEGTGLHGLREKELRAMLEAQFGELIPLESADKQEKCRYYTLPGFKGNIGFISPISHKFCSDCNRIRLTADGFLKTCLQYDSGVSLKALLGESDEIIGHAIIHAVQAKPLEHHFSSGARTDNDETLKMSQIGG